MVVAIVAFRNVNFKPKFIEFELKMKSTKSQYKLDNMIEIFNQNQLEK